MSDEVKKLLFDILNSITKVVLYKYGKRELKLEITSETPKEEIIELILKDVSENEKHKEHLFNFINIVQEWGRQHIFMFRSSPAVRSKYKNFTSAQIQKILNDHKLGIKLEEITPLFMPEEQGFELYKVVHEEGRRLAFYWAEKRVIYSRNPSGDYTDPETSLEYRAWQTHQARGLLVMDWNLTLGQMMIRVSQADTKAIYENSKQQALNFAHRFLSIPLTDWAKLDIRKSIANIKNSGEVSTKKFNQETQSGGKQSLQARDKKHGIEKDSELTQASLAMKDRFASTYGNFFWSVDDDEGVKREIHTTIDSDSNSLLVYGIQTEQLVRHIIGRIIHHTR